MSDAHAPAGPAYAGPAGPGLELRHVSKTFAGRTVLDVDSLAVRRGEVHALLGQNGSGKSTLIKILSGFHEADPHDDLAILIDGVPGTELRNHPGVRFVHQDLGLVLDMSIMDNLYLGRSYPTRALTVRNSEARADARERLAKVGLDSLDVGLPCGGLSPAQRTGVAIARALSIDDERTPGVLVLDEPTATLPAQEVDRLLDTLRRVAGTGVAILYVTHHLDEVFRIASDVSILRDGIVVASGPTSAFTRASLVHHLVGSDLESFHESAPVAAVGPATDKSHPRLVVEGLAGDRIEDVSFSAWPGEIIGLHGVTGSGRDTVLGTIFGARRRVSGSVRLDGDELPSGRPDISIRRRIGLVPAERKTLGAVMNLSAAENLTLAGVRSFWRRGRVDVHSEQIEAESWFERLEVRPSHGANLPLSTFSGGNQQKILLAKWLRLDPLVLLLDDPTQGVDVGAKEVIHRTLLEAASAGLTVVIASSDDEEMAALCNTVHILHRGRIVDSVVGDAVTEAELGRRLNALGHTSSPPSERAPS